MNIDDANKDLLEKDEDDWTIFDWIRFLCGAETLRKIREAYSGIEFKVPNKTDCNGETWKDLVRLLGEEDARCFVKNFGAEVLYIAFGKDRKKDQIKQLLMQGQKNRDIARHCKVSERYVRMVKNKTGTITLPQTPNSHLSQF